MEPSAPVSFTDLLQAFEWVSAAAVFENAAYICRRTGMTYFASSSMDLDEDLPVGGAVPAGGAFSDDGLD